MKCKSMVPKVQLNCDMSSLLLQWQKGQDRHTLSMVTAWVVKKLVCSFSPCAFSLVPCPHRAARSCSFHPATFSIVNRKSSMVHTRSRWWMVDGLPPRSMHQWHLPVEKQRGQRGGVVLGEDKRCAGGNIHLPLTLALLKRGNLATWTLSNSNATLSLSLSRPLFTLT